jgi:hypothetical protein
LQHIKFIKQNKSKKFNQKFFLNLDLFFLCVFKVKEHLMAIPLIIWNHFTQKSIILVAKLSSSQLLSLSRNPATPPLSSTKRRTKKKGK